MTAPYGTVRPHYRAVADLLTRTPPARVAQKREEAERAFHRLGITFAVAGEDTGTERLIPFDLIPRIIAADEWSVLERGLLQRVRALNAFLDDIYHDQRILNGGPVAADRVLSNTQYRAEMRGVDVPGRVYAHVAGVDVVRAGAGEFYVLEDNLRVPSGVSYMLENRQVSKRVFADAFRDLDIQPVDDYPVKLHATLASLTPRPGEVPVIAVLTPGIYNSAYFEHAFLAQQMGALLVEGGDLVVDDDDVVHVRTIGGLVRVDVIYRRVDDLFLDPEAFRPDSALGVPGLMRAWRAGNVALANAPGAGVADDKVVYAYVPALIRYYLGEDPLLPSVETFVCLDPAQRSHVLANLDDLVLKPANESGGYGIFIGSFATAAEKDEMRARVLAEPRNWIAQPILSLSTAPTLCDGRVAPRHVDLRPFILSGEAPYVTNGGLTRVALREGSLVVNSSQGGGSKVSWIMVAEHSSPLNATSGLDSATP